MSSGGAGVDDRGGGGGEGGGEKCISERDVDPLFPFPLFLASREFSLILSSLSLSRFLSPIAQESLFAL